MSDLPNRIWVKFSEIFRDDFPVCTIQKFQQSPFDGGVEFTRAAPKEWKPASEAPNGVPVIVAGGLAMRKTGGEWFSGMEEPLYQRHLEWLPELFMTIPTPPETDP